MFLFILTVSLLILIVGPVIQTLCFLTLSAGEGGPRGADLGVAIGTVFFLILLVRGRCFFLFGEKESGVVCSDN